MVQFLFRRVGIMLLTALCLTFIVFFLTNLSPNLEKLAKSEGNQRMTDEQVASWLERNGHSEPLFIKYGQWLGVAPGFIHENDDGTVTGRCIAPGGTREDAPRFCGVLQGNWGMSTVAGEPVLELTLRRLALTGWLMLWVMVVMVPMALVVGVLSGMREGSGTDRS
ncbi:MAG: ABC transporter permease, partial [Pseudomonadota bacterium]